MCKELESIIIDDDAKKYFQVGIQLPPQEKEELLVFLKKNVNAFAWSAYETPVVNPNFFYHHLNVNPAIVPKKQPSLYSSKEHAEAIKEKEKI